MRSEVLAVVLALIVSVIAPMVMAHQTNKAARQAKLEDWARFDSLAAKADATEAARARDAEARAADAEALATRVDGIHALADGNLSASLEAQLEAVRGQAVLMHAANGDAAPERAAALEAVEAKIASLEQTLADRRLAQSTAEAIERP